MIGVELPALTAAQMIEVDRLMVERFGIGLEQMMENAGRNLAALARLWLGGRVVGRRISVLCGGGNNGGGGMVAARHLHNWGAQVAVTLAADPQQLKEAPTRQWSALAALGLERPAFELETSDLILDALLGYGAKGDPRGPIRSWIARANGSHLPILSLDSPSGLDVTTGIPGLPCIVAAATMTLALPKTGLRMPTARQHVGQLYLADIGVPPELYAAPSLGIALGPIFSETSLIRLDDENGARHGQ